MIERRQIVDLWRRGDAAALVTLVRAAGSSLPEARGALAGCARWSSCRDHQRRMS